MRITWGVLALALALGGCQTTGTTSAEGGNNVQPEPTAAATPTAVAAAPAVEAATPADPLAGLSGQWRGAWPSGTPSTLSVGGTPLELDVRYCFAEDCFTPEDAALSDGALMWGDARRFTWRRDGKVVRGEMRTGGRKFRVKMRRAD